MKKLILSFILISTSVFVNAQQPTFEWAKQIATKQTTPKKVVTDSQGNSYTLTYSYTTAQTYIGPIDLDPGPGTFYWNGSGNANFLVKLNPAGAFLWAKAFSPFGAATMDIDKDGNLFLTGYFFGTFDFDPGNAIFNLTANGSSYDAFVIKLDMNGDFQWAKSFGGPNHDYGITLNVDSASIYISGTYENTVDFDPGPGIYSLTGEPANQSIAYILKLDANGNFMWVKSFDQQGLNKYMLFEELKKGTDGIYATGAFYGLSFDFNPSTTASFNLTSADSSFNPRDVFFMKLDFDGNFIWAKKIGGSGLMNGVCDYAKSLGLDEWNNLYVTGIFVNTVDFDPGFGVYNLTAANGYNVFLLKLDLNGNFTWAKRWDTGIYQISSFLKENSSVVDKQGNTYMIGSFSGTRDFDPGTGTYFLTSADTNLAPYYNDGSILKLDSAGSLIWAGKIGGIGVTTPYSINIAPGGNIYSIGSFVYTTDFDPDPLNEFNLSSFEPDYFGGPSDLYILKLSEDSCSNFYLIIDSANVVVCGNQGYISGHGVYGNPPYNYSWSTSPTVLDSVLLPATQGMYQLTATDAMQCSSSRTVIVNGPSSVAVNDYDLKVNMISPWGFRPNTYGTLIVDGYNETCNPVPGNLKVVLDPLLTYSGAVPLPDNITGDTLIWNFNNLTYDSLHIKPHITVLTNPGTAVGDTVCNMAFIEPLQNDFGSNNNFTQVCTPILNSYDPNGISVSPAGLCGGYVASNQKLTYMIQFQNTGNAEAVDVNLKDSIDVNLDLSTVNVVASSHHFILEVLPGNVLSFNFNNIHLADSTTNEPESHGYVIFEILPNAGIPNNTMIINKAAIYFDHNIPVITNTVSNIFSQVMPPIISTNTQSPTLCAGEAISVGNNIYSTPGLYSDTLLLASGCRSIMNTMLTILPENMTSASYTLCNGDSIEIDSIIYYTAGSYTNSYTAVNGCDSIINLNITIQTVDNGVTQTGSTLSVNLSSATYQWIDCNNNNATIINETGQAFSPSADGNYAVVITANNCTDTSACYYVLTTAIGNNIQNGFTIYPNPGDGVFTITSAVQLVDATINIYNTLGERILSETMDNNSQSFIIDGAGMYYIELKTKKGKSGFSKIIKE